MEIKDQDVSHRGMVTSVCEQPCFAIPDTITQQRDRGHRGGGGHWGRTGIN